MKNRLAQSKLDRSYVVFDSEDVACRPAEQPDELRVSYRSCRGQGIWHHICEVLVNRDAVSRAA